ncbi:MAG TPA: hypothetical protein VG408_08905 [Actinomycetota bacterium]|nr:hypothetical protein [Actinomycetota bacterium]
MRAKRVAAALAVLGILAVPTVAPAAPSAGGLASDNVTYITTIPFDAGGATGARLYGKHLYVAGARGFSIYDVSDPLAPSLLSYTPSAAFPAEDVDTNGEILLFQDQTVRNGLFVYDVENKAAPQQVAEVTDLNDHTFTCVFDCRWAYGAGGVIVDLRDPAAPEKVGYWSNNTPGFGFDTTEVSPGMVLTASRVMYLLDGRKDPADPNVVASGTTDDNRLIHSVRWPNKGKDDFILVQGETPLSRTCNDRSGAFMTWDASRWRKTHTFSLIDEFRVVNGTMTDGNPPANVLGCTNLWFQEHPTFDNGGIVAAAFFEHGVRFLKVSGRGEISQVGYFTPLGGETTATYWLNDEIVYSIDLTRGIDILRFEDNG